MSVPSDNVDTETPFQYCRRITKESATNFYWAITVLPDRQRQAVFAVYAFARKCDDIADSSFEISTKERQLNQLRETVSQVYEGKADDKLSEALMEVIERYGIPENLFQDLIDGVEMDLSKTRYRTFSELKEYCYRVASVVGLMLIEIFGYDEKVAREHAVRLGYGMQLTNIIRDVAEDLNRDRIYLPQEDLAKFDYSEQQLKDRVVNDNLYDLLQYEFDRAEKFFDLGRQLFPHLPTRARICPAGLYGIYYQLLQKMKSDGWHPFQDKPQISTFRKISAVFAQWINSIIKSLS